MISWKNVSSISTFRKQYFKLSRVDYRVHWLRARAHAMRWAEELNLTHHEMSWTTQYFLHKGMIWKQYRDNVLNATHLIGTPYSRGAVAYAVRQIDFWLTMAQRAEIMFQNVNTNYNRR